MSGAALLSYRRACGSARWVQRHVRSREAVVILRAFAQDASRSPLWDATVDDDQPYHLLDGSGDLADLWRLHMEGLRAA